MEKDVEIKKKVEIKQKEFIKTIKWRSKKQRRNGLFHDNIKNCDRLPKKYNKLSICAAQMPMKMLIEIIFKILRQSKPYKGLLIKW